VLLKLGERLFFSSNCLPGRQIPTGQEGISIIHFNVESKETLMRLSAPKEMTFWIAVVLAILALLGQLAIAALAPYAFWILLVAFVLLALGTFVAGL
jgi:hypothetical protein